MCKRLMMVLIVLGVLFAPGMAFADDGFEYYDGGDFSDRVIYGPNVLDITSGTYGVQVYAGNKFNASLCVLGYDPTDSRFTSDVKAYLSNESTGGSFYEFSNLFTNNNTGHFGGFDFYNISFTTSVDTNNLLYGARFVWIAKYTDTLRQAAYARVEEVLDGNISGGSGGVSGGGSIPKSITLEPIDYDKNLSSDRVQYNMDIDFHLTFSDNAVALMESYVNDYPYLLVYSSNYRCYSGQTSARAPLHIYLSKQPYVYTNGTAFNTECKYVTIQTVDFNNGVDGYTKNDLNFTSMNNATNITISVTNGSGNVLRMYNSSNAAPVVPPTQWPEPEPTTPTEPPEVPEPPSEPNPTEPTNPVLPQPPVFLPPILSTEPTYTTIDLSAVLDAMAKHCQHLQTCMTECFDSYYSAITQFETGLAENNKEFLRSWFRVTLDTITDCFDGLKDYLQRLFEWLEDELDFTFTGGDFDDSSIVWWLKQIYSKLGSGTTVRPTDPVVDPTGIGDWFDQLIKNFVLDLLALGQDFLADVVEMFRQLTTKFPISIPWDIVAILTLFAAEPETPVLNIPQYALTGVNTISQVGSYVIDLQDYDGVMSVVRNVEKVVFAFWLCWKIDFFKQAFDIMTGGK